MLIWLAQNAVASAALAALVLIACLFCRRRPAVQHALWLLVLLKLLTPAWFIWPWSLEQACGRWFPPSDNRTELVARLAEENVPREKSIGPANANPLPNAANDDDQGRAGLPTRLDGSGEPSYEQRARRTHIAKSDVTDATPQQDRSAVSTVGSWHDRWPLRWQTVLLIVWAAGAGVIGLLQLVRVIQFKRLAAQGNAAPNWFADELAELATRLSIRPPTSVLCEQIVSPVLWCWGRPKLLWPAALAEPHRRDRLRGIIAHELAHVRRCDHWVVRLEMVAACFWWWNPVFWYVRRRIHQSAELACDAWVVWALPEDRRAYAESLVEVSRSVSNRTTVAPALGAIGEVRRNFERRLGMIFRDDVSHRLSWTGAMVILLVAVVVLPGWSLGQGDERKTSANLDAATPDTSEAAKETDAKPAVADPSPSYPSPAVAAETAPTFAPPTSPQPAMLPYQPSPANQGINSQPAAASDFVSPAVSARPPTAATLPVPALKDITPPMTIESLRLKERDALDVLQILAAVMARAQAASDGSPFVLAFAPATEEMPAAPTVYSAGVSLAPVPFPGGIVSPAIQAPTSGIAPSWPAANVPRTTPAYRTSTSPSRGVAYTSTRSSSPPFRLAVDVRTNTLIVRGQKDAVEQVLRLAAMLDSTEESLEDSLSDSLGCQVVPVTYREPLEIAAVLRGLGIDVDLTTLKSGEKKGDAANEGGLFLIISDTDTEEIGKLIKSLDVEGESAPPAEDTPPILEEEHAQPPLTNRS